MKSSLPFPFWRRDPLLFAGAVLFGMAMTAFAVQNLLFTQTIMGLEPLPMSLPGLTTWAICNSAILFGAGVSIILRWHLRWAAIALGSLLLLWLLLLHGPGLLASPANGGFWTVAFETLALCSSAWILAGSVLAAPARDEKQNSLSTFGASLGRFGYGLSLLAFGVLHLLYPKYVAGALPDWLPWHYFWTYFVAVAFFAASASITSGIKGRLAATCTGAMFLTWVLMLHLPRVIGKPHSAAEWTSMFVALAMGSGGWLLTSRFMRSSSR